MDDIEELSKRLLGNDYFVKSLKYRIYRFSNEKTDMINHYLFKRLSIYSYPMYNTDRFMFLAYEPRFFYERASITSSAFEKRESCDSVSSINSSPIFKQYLQRYSLTEYQHNINALTMYVASYLEYMIKRECNILGKYDKIGSIGTESERLLSYVIENMKYIQKSYLYIVKYSLTEQISAIRYYFSQQMSLSLYRVKQYVKAERIHYKSLLLKKQRKKVAQSILDFSKINQYLSTFSNLQDMDNILSDSSNSSYQYDETSIRKRNNHYYQQHNTSLSQLSSKIAEVKNSQTKISKYFEERFLKEVEQNKSDVQQLTNKIIEWKLKNYEKIYDGFTGLWNVVTDVYDKLHKLTLRVGYIENDTTGR